MEFGGQLGRSEIEEREIERYPDERIADIPRGYLERVESYISGNEEDTELLGRALELERNRRERKDLRLDEVPSAEDLFKIKKYADERLLYEERSRRRMSDGRGESVPALTEIDEAVIRRLASDEINIRRSHQFMEHLETDYSGDRLELVHPQEKFEGDTGLYMTVGNSEVKGVKYRTDGMMEPGAAPQLESLASEAAEAQAQDSRAIGGKTFLDLTRKHADLLDATGTDIDRAEMTGYDIEDFVEKVDHLKDKSVEALETLDRIGVTYFEIEGFHTEEVASLVDHISVRDGFEVERISTHTDTDLNPEEWRKHHERRIRQDTAGDNALRLFLDHESN